MSEKSVEAPIKVFLLLKNRLLRDALNRLLCRRPDLLVVGSTMREDCLPQTVTDSQCDVSVLDFLDVRWLPRNLTLTAGHHSIPKCLLIGMDEDFDQFDMAVRGGAIGYLLKDATASNLVSAVRATARGEATCPPKLCAVLFHTLSLTATSDKASTCAQPPPLTLRQQRLVELIASGLTNKEIASHLNLSHFTVRNHVHLIMKQLRVESRSQAVYAILSHGSDLGDNSVPPLLRPRLRSRYNS